MERFDRFVQTPWAYVVLAILVLIAALPGATSMPVLDRDEARFVQASSQMLETGDYVVINFQDEYRNKKPIGIHWLQTASVSTLSSAAERHITAYRVPSLIAGMVAALAAFWGGTALVGRRAAFMGASMFGLSLLLTTEAHIAKTDAALTASIVIAMAALARLRIGASKWVGVLAWAAFGASILVKGPVGPMVILSTLGALAIWERKVDWMKPLLFWVGPSLFLIITIPWFVAIQIATGGAFLREAAGVDMAGKMAGAAEGHGAPPGLHILMLPLLFFPGTLFLIPGIWHTAQRLIANARDPNNLPEFNPEKSSTDPKTIAQKANADARKSQISGLKFLVCWAIPTWILFELAPTKLIHYTLPAYPALALMAGAALDEWTSTNKWTVSRWPSFALFVIAGLLLAFLPSPWALEAIRNDAVGNFDPILRDRIAFNWTQDWQATGVSIWPTLLILAGLIGTGYAAIQRHTTGALGGMLACALLVGFTYRTVVLPNQSWMLGTPAALSALEEVCALPPETPRQKRNDCEGPAPTQVQTVGYSEPSLVFSLAGKALLEPKSSTDIPDTETDPRPAWLINTAIDSGREALAALIANADAADRCIRMARRHVLNYSNGDPAELVAAVIEPAGCTVEDPTMRLRGTTAPVIEKLNDQENAETTETTQSEPTATEATE